MSEPIWLTRQIIVAIHDEQLAIHGGASGLRDEGMLESALDRPRNKWAYENAELPELAAAYAFAIARNHPFVDGNKRTAWVVSRTFLRLNGCDLAASQAEKYEAMMGLAEGSVSEEEFAGWIRAHLTAPG